MFWGREEEEVLGFKKKENRKDKSDDALQFIHWAITEHENNMPFGFRSEEFGPTFEALKKEEKLEVKKYEIKMRRLITIKNIIDNFDVLVEEFNKIFDKLKEVNSEKSDYMRRCREFDELQKAYDDSVKANLSLIKKLEKFKKPKKTKK